MNGVAPIEIHGRPIHQIRPRPLHPRSTIVVVVVTGGSRSISLGGPPMSRGRRGR